MKKLVIILLVLLEVDTMVAQVDSLTTKVLEEMVVTATRTEKLLSAVPMPVLLVSKKEIESIGSLRLNDVLLEQVGLTIVDDHGQGIQMQGFDPDYTLILINGEPLIGRVAGTLDLSRLSVGNIKQIEIVKGASSSLYGSEALAGVVNIITDQASSDELSLSTRYGTNETSDISVQGSLGTEKSSFNLFYNRFQSGGYDLTPQTYGNTVNPFLNHTFQANFSTKPYRKIKLNFSSRLFAEAQDNKLAITNNGTEQRLSGSGEITDLNLNPSIDIFWSDRLKTQTRFYYSRYSAGSELRFDSNQEIFESNYFNQTFLRPEVQTELFLDNGSTLTTGVGGVWESVASDRYTDQKYFQTKYAFIQYEFVPSPILNITVGSRYDSHSVYGSQLSPKIAVKYNINDKVTLRISSGLGFKAPDFRQLYLNFSNAIAGYMVLGTEELPLAIERWQQQNQLGALFLNTEDIGSLGAEQALTNNISVQYAPNDKLNFTINGFRNDINNLIESQLVAQLTNAQSVFSYRNLNNVFTSGLESELKYKLTNQLTLSGGYQYLLAMDKAVVNAIKEGKVFKRNNETLASRRVAINEYGGLFGRSKHMYNLKLFYQNSNKGFDANIRAIYRGRFGLGDMNGNLILDDDKEYIDGYWRINIAVSKSLIDQKLMLQTGIDNLTNFIDPTNLPSIAGRLWWGSLKYTINKNQ